MPKKENNAIVCQTGWGSNDSGLSSTSFLITVLANT